MGFLSCVDFWANRYQTLMVGIGAIWIGIGQLRLADKQRLIMEKQNDIQKALAKTKTDTVLRQLVKATHMVSFFCPVGTADGDLSWEFPLGYFKIGDWDKDEVLGWASVAYPNDISLIQAYLDVARQFASAAEARQIFPAYNYQSGDPRPDYQKAYDDAANVMIAKSHEVLRTLGVAAAAVDQATDIVVPRRI